MSTCAALMTAPNVFTLEAALGTLESLMRTTVGCFALFHAVVAAVLLLGIGLQRALLGEVKEQERDKVAHAALQLQLKNVLFIFYVLSPETLPELLFWVGWLCCLSLLKVLCEFANLRVTRLRQSASVPPAAPRPLAVFLALTCALTAGYFAIIVYAFGGPGLQPLLFLLYEPLYMMLELGQVSWKMAAHLRGLHSHAPEEDSDFPTEAAFDIARLLCTLLHFSHILGYFFSMSVIDLLLVVYNRNVLQQLLDRIAGLRKYRAALGVIDATFPDATLDQLRQSGDPCAICYDHLLDPAEATGPRSGSGPAPAALVAKVLPCGHLFHLRCIRQWMEHQHNCPICKREVFTPQHCP